MDQALENEGTGVSGDALVQSFLVLGATLIAFMLARLFRAVAEAEIGNIQD